MAADWLGWLEDSMVALGNGLLKLQKAQTVSAHSHILRLAAAWPAGE